MATEAVSRFMYYPRLIESLEALPAKLFDIDLDPRKPAAAAHQEQAEKEGHKGRIELNRQRLRGGIFTAHGDNEVLTLTFTLILALTLAQP